VKENGKDARKEKIVRNVFLINGFQWALQKMYSLREKGLFLTFFGATALHIVAMRVSKVAFSASAVSPV